MLKGCAGQPEMKRKKKKHCIIDKNYPPFYRMKNEQTYS